MTANEEPSRSPTLPAGRWLGIAADASARQGNASLGGLLACLVDEGPDTLLSLDAIHARLASVRRAEGTLLHLGPRTSFDSASFSREVLPKLAAVAATAALPVRDPGNWAREALKATGLLRGKGRLSPTSQAMAEVALVAFVTGAEQARAVERLGATRLDRYHEIEIGTEEVRLDGRPFPVAFRHNVADLATLAGRASVSLDAIVRSVAEGAAMPTNAAFDLVDVGKQSTRLLFPPPARERVRAWLRADGPVLSFVRDPAAFPVELLHFGDDADDSLAGFLGFSAAISRMLGDRRVWEFPTRLNRQARFLWASHPTLPCSQAERTELERRLGQRGGTLDEPALPAGVRPAAALLDALASRELTGFHVAAHGFPARPGHAWSRLLLQVLVGEGRQDLLFGADDFLRREDLVVPPFAFLNACHAGGSVAPLGLDLPAAWSAAGCAALIAPACAVPDVFAARFADRFYEVCLPVATLASPAPSMADGLRAVRRTFLGEGNPLGLAYGLYGSPFLSFND